MHRRHWTAIVAMGLLAAGLSSLASAQDVRPIITTPGGQSLHWILSPQLAKEMEIVAEQREQLEKIRTESQAKYQELNKSLEGLPQNERWTKFIEQGKALSEESEKKVLALLLPHQVKRLNQVMLQMKLQTMGYGYGSSLGGDDLGKALALTDEQKEALKQKEIEVRKEIAEKTAEFQKKLQSDAREKLFSVLTPAQRKTLDEMIGAKFEWGNPWGAGGGAQIARPIEKK